MSRLTEIPIKVEPDAAARVAELGFQNELAQMIEHARATAPDVRRIRVSLEHDYDDPSNDPQVTVWVYRDELADPTVLDPVESEWGRWLALTFPPEVTLHLSVITSIYGGPDGW